MFLVFSLIGAIANRVRGGGINDRLVKLEWIDSVDDFQNKLVHDIIFALIFSSIAPIAFVWQFFWVFACLFLTMWAGRSVGWGVYIDGIIAAKKPEQGEVKIIDELVFSKTNHPVLRHTIALSLRGLFWTACLAVGFALSYLPSGIPCPWGKISLIGLLMGITYLCTARICQFITRKTGFKLPEWGASEMVWGFIMWGLIYAIIN